MNRIEPKNWGEKWVLDNIHNSVSWKYLPLIWLALAVMFGHLFIKGREAYHAMMCVSCLWLALIHFERRQFINIIKRCREVKQNDGVDNISEDPATHRDAVP